MLTLVYKKAWHSGVEGQVSQTFMMMLQRSLCVLLLFCSLAVGKGLSETGEIQESSALQQVSDVQPVRVREKRDASGDKISTQQSSDSVVLELRLRQPSDQSDSLAALRKLLEEQRKLGKPAQHNTRARFREA